MTPAHIKPAILVLMKCYPSMTVEKICFMSGFAPDSVRRVLREDPAFVATGPKTLAARVWSYDPDREMKKKVPKVSPKKHIEYKANSEARESKRLKEPYFNAERVWGI